MCAEAVRGAMCERRPLRLLSLHGTAHEALMAIPLIGCYFRAMGMVPAAPDSISTALAEGRDVALWPGERSTRCGGGANGTGQILRVARAS